MDDGCAFGLLSGTSRAGQPHKHRPVEDVDVFPGNLHGFLDVAGAEGGHQRDVVVVGFVQLLDGLGDEVVMELGEHLVINLDGSAHP